MRVCIIDIRWHGRGIAHRCSRTTRKSDARGFLFFLCSALTIYWHATCADLSQDASLNIVPDWIMEFSSLEIVGERKKEEIIIEMGCMISSHIHSYPSMMSAKTKTYNNNIIIICTYNNSRCERHQKKWLYIYSLILYKQRTKRKHSWCGWEAVWGSELWLTVSQTLRIFTECTQSV